MSSRSSPRCATRSRLGDASGELQAGDALLVRGTWKALSKHVAATQGARRRRARCGSPPGRTARHRGQGGDRRARRDGQLLATNAVPPVVASMLAAGVLILIKVVTIEQAYRAISWTTVILVAGMFPLSLAMRTTGAAEKLANQAGRHRGRLGSLSTADRPVRDDCRARSADQQHGDGLDRDPDRAFGGGRTRCRRLPVLMCINVATRRHCSRRRDPCQPDGHGTGRRTSSRTTGSSASPCCCGTS